MIAASVSAWNLDGDCTFTPVDSYNGGTTRVSTGDGNSYYLKQRSSHEHVQREFTLLSWLRAHGVMTAPPLLSETGHPSLQIGEQVFALYPALSGTNGVDHYAPGAEERARAYGVGIAQLHRWLAEYPQTSDFHTFDLLAEITEWAEFSAQQHLAGLQADHVPESVRILCQFLEKHQSLLPSHLIHRDIHPANMLLIDRQVGGYLDFDLACVGLRVFDPCYCLSSILVGGFYRVENQQRWLSLLPHLLARYHSVRPLHENERQAVYPVLIAIELLFLVFSCRNSRYDAAQYNANVIAWLVENRQMIEEAVKLRRGFL